MKKPKISVCIPVHNAELWLAESIQSIIDQTFTDWEIVIVDDGSTDSSHKIMTFFKMKYYDKIKEAYLPNQGIAKTRNHAIDMASGEIICVQDADDISQKDRLEKTWKFFQRHKDVDLTYGTAQYIDVLGRPFKEVKSEPFDFESIKQHNYIQHPTVAYRRNAILETPYRADCKVLDDWFLYYDFHKSGKKIAPMTDTLAFYRVLRSSVSHSADKALEVETMRKKFLEEANENLSPVGS